MEIKENRT